LKLWDTPGFSDTKKLLQRLRNHEGALNWLLRETWDRTTNPALYNAQIAAKNAKEQAHVILYLVDGRQHPEYAASYAADEVELLEEIGQPVVLLINQTGEHA